MSRVTARRTARAATRIALLCARDRQADGCDESERVRRWRHVLDTLNGPLNEREMHAIVREARAEIDEWTALDSSVGASGE